MLTLDDVAWRNGEILVRGKGNRRDLLPLPVDVGTALAVYCQQGRPVANSRSIFLHIRAPYAALTASGVSHIVKQACRRAGVPPSGAHSLRHSAATAMRRAGVPLFEIGQVLRHRHTVTTVGYARDDVNTLRVVAHEWPGGAA